MRRTRKEFVGSDRHARRTGRVISKRNAAGSLEPDGGELAAEQQLFHAAAAAVQLLLHARA
jgi:hypothetical protein